MVVSPFLKPIALLAGCLGIAQSLAWMILSILGIASYFCAIDLNLKAGNFAINLQVMYFIGENCYDNMYVPFPNWSHIVMVGSFLYLFGSLVWLIVSACLLLNIKSKELKNKPAYLYSWITVTFLISILDFLFGLFFGLNYGENTQADKVEFVYFLMSTISGVMMTIAFRGFVLWIINVVCASFLCKFAADILKHNRELSGRDNYDYPRPAWNTGSPEPSPRVPPWDKNYRDSHLEPQHRPLGPTSPHKPVSSPAQRPVAPPPAAPFRHDERPDYEGYNNPPPRLADNSQYGRNRPPPLNLGGGNGYRQPPSRPITEPRPDYSPSIPKLNPSMNRDYNRGNRMY